MLRFDTEVVLIHCITGAHEISVWEIFSLAALIAHMASASLLATPHPLPLTAGLAAIGCAKSMGAIVRVFDTRAAVEEQVRC